MRLSYDAGNGYLRSLLDALAIPVASQTLVFSQDQLSGRPLIDAQPARHLLQRHRGGGMGARRRRARDRACRIRARASVFYTLEQKRRRTAAPVVRKRNDDCLACHLSWDTLGVPGLMTTSMYPLPDDPNAYANGFTTVTAARWSSGGAAGG